MVAPAFGFSVGDFVVGISLVKRFIEALQDSAGSKPQYQELITELRSLEGALIEVKKLQVEMSQVPQKIALEQAASQCQETIEKFLEKNSKFSATLGSSSIPSKDRWKMRLHKVEWALCREDEISRLRAKITGHTLTINTLLHIIQQSALRIQAENSNHQDEEIVNLRKETGEMSNLAKKNNELLNAQADLILTVTRSVAACSTQKQNEELTAIICKVLDSNMKIYTLVMEMQKAQQNIPRQIDRQQPVYFEDAHGRITPLHIEFINSFDAFQAVMEVRFRDVPGLNKVKNKEYVLQDMKSKSKLDLSASWESIFLPGRKVTMSMLFRKALTRISLCPGCGKENDFAENGTDAEIQCTNDDCGMWYQQTYVPKPPNASSATQRGAIDLLREFCVPGFHASKINEEPEMDAVDQISLFRRVHVHYWHLHWTRERHHIDTSDIPSKILGLLNQIPSYDSWLNDHNEDHSNPKFSDRSSYVYTWFSTKVEDMFREGSLPKDETLSLFPFVRALSEGRTLTNRRLISIELELFHTHKPREIVNFL